MPKLIGKDAGKVLQVKQTVMTGEYTHATQTDGRMEIVTGLNTSITPLSSTSKILYQCVVHVGSSQFYDIGIHIIKNATSTAGTVDNGSSPLGGSYLTDSAGNDIRGHSDRSNPRGTGLLNLYLLDAGDNAMNPQYLIAPVTQTLLDHHGTTSQITYQFAFRWYNSNGGNLYVNRTHSNLDDSANDHYDHNPVSTVTLTEIA